MNQPTHRYSPLIGCATSTGKRHPINDDHLASFVVLRENTTRRLARKQSASAEKTVLIGSPVGTIQDSRPIPGSMTSAPRITFNTVNGPNEWIDNSTDGLLTDGLSTDDLSTDDLSTDDLTEKIYIAVVADGVTSTHGGGKASQIAVESLRINLQDSPSRQETISEWLEFAIQRANEEILFEAKRNPQWKGMSSTIALAALAGEKLYILHLGDSRAYLMRKKQLYQLTTDHTWAQESLNSGAPLRVENGPQPGSNHLLRYLGAQKLSAVDRGILSPTTDQREEYLLVEPGDAVLLCTDGLYRRLTNKEITATVWAHTGYPQDAVDELLEQVVVKGEQDDITAILLEIPLALKGLPTAVQNMPLTEPPVRSSTNWLRTAFIIIFALILMIVVALLIWSWGG